MVADLIVRYLQAKHEEALAEGRRVALAEEIAKKLGVPAEGSEAHDVGDYKVTVKQPINRKVDFEALAELDLKYPPIKTKEELDLVGLRWFQENDPATYLKIAKTVTATPGRVSIEVKTK